MVLPLEHESHGESAAQIRNVGWTLGNDCPFRCLHCYSMSARLKGKNLSPWMVDRIVDQLSGHGIETVNLGGNEPLYTKLREATPRARIGHAIFVYELN